MKDIIANVQLEIECTEGSIIEEILMKKKGLDRKYPVTVDRTILYNVLDKPDLPTITAIIKSDDWGVIDYLFDVKIKSKSEKEFLGLKYTTTKKELVLPHAHVKEDFEFNGISFHKTEALEFDPRTLKQYIKDNKLLHQHIFSEEKAEEKA